MSPSTLRGLSPCPHPPWDNHVRCIKQLVFSNRPWDFSGVSGESGQEGTRGWAHRPAGVEELGCPVLEGAGGEA